MRPAFNSNHMSLMCEGVVEPSCEEKARDMAASSADDVLSDLKDDVSCDLAEKVAKAVKSAVFKIVHPLLEEVKVLKAEVEQLKVQMQSKTFGPFEQKDCSICHLALYTYRRCILPCKHIFHYDCMDKWASRSIHCPLCRICWRK